MLLINEQRMWMWAISDERCHLYSCLTYSPALQRHLIHTWLTPASMPHLLHIDSNHTIFTISLPHLSWFSHLTSLHLPRSTSLPPYLPHYHTWVHFITPELSPYLPAFHTWQHLNIFISYHTYLTFTPASPLYLSHFRLCFTWLIGSCFTFLYISPIPFLPLSHSFPSLHCSHRTILPFVSFHLSRHVSRVTTTPASTLLLHCYTCLTLQPPSSSSLLASGPYQFFFFSLFCLPLPPFIFFVTTFFFPPFSIFYPPFCSTPFFLLPFFLSIAISINLAFSLLTSSSLLSSSYSYQSYIFLCFLLIPSFFFSSLSIWCLPLSLLPASIVIYLPHPYTLLTIVPASPLHLLRWYRRSRVFTQHIHNHAYILLSVWLITFLTS